MFKTRSMTLSNGKSGDQSEKLYIRLMWADHKITYAVAWETNGKGYFINEEDNIPQYYVTCTPGYWHGTVFGLIEWMLLEQTAIDTWDKVYEYLTSDGEWMIDFDDEDFAPDRWEVHTN